MIFRSTGTTYKQPHIHKALIDQWGAAPWAWVVYYKVDETCQWVYTSVPDWQSLIQYKLEPSSDHPSYSVWKEYTANPEWWVVGFGNSGLCCKVQLPLSDKYHWRVELEYRLLKSGKHPDNIKPKKKHIDWDKMPRGTLTNRGEFLAADDGIRRYRLLGEAFRVDHWSSNSLRLAEQTEFTYWGGGECPVSEGVIVEVVFRYHEAPNEKESAEKFEWKKQYCGGDIIAYRIIGLADGWTDTPEESV